MYSDNSKEIKAAVRIVGFPHRTPVLGIPATNTIAESHVKIVVYGTRTLLAAAGLPCAFWPYAARCFCFGLTNKAGRIGMTSYELQQQEPFTGMQIPFGCKVQFKPSPISKQQPLKFQGETVPGVCLGYVLDPEGRRSGEYLVVALDAFVGKAVHRLTPAA